MAVRVTGLVSGMDTDSLVQELVSAYATKKDDITKAQTKLSWTQDAWKEMNNKIYGFYTGSLSNMRLSSSITNMKKTTLSDSTKATITADASVLNGTQTLKINKLATAGYLTGTKLQSTENAYTSKTALSELGIKAGNMTLEVGGEKKTIEVTEDMTIADFTAALSEQGVSASFDQNQQRFFVNSKETGLASDFNFVVESQEDLDRLQNLGLATADDVKKITGQDVESSAYATKQAAGNAEIELNGAVFEGESNTFQINGLTITATGVSDSTMSLVTETDVDGIYDSIKSFLKDYNELIKAMDEAYNADQAKGYEPLTDDEKAEMSDKEVEKWEEKIKTSLLRRDSTLGSISSMMKIQMAKSYEVNGKTYSLSSFGIKTLGYFTASDNEKGVYHIDGDSEDDSTKANEDKLKTAIANDPEAVANFFQQLAKGVYDELNKKMGTTELSSAFKVYNDKQMQKDYDSYTKSIKEWEEKLQDKEDYYYNQFSTMESALSKLNSQQSQLSSLLGTS